MAGESASGFGSCCRYLKDVLETEDFEPLLYVGDDGVLYMSVGVEFPEGEEGDDDEEEPDFLDHPIYCCPFCGTKLQNPEDIDAKADNE